MRGMRILIACVTVHAVSLLILSCPKVGIRPRAGRGERRPLACNCWRKVPGASLWQSVQASLSWPVLAGPLGGETA
jgi:hypothetical protein